MVLAMSGLVFSLPVFADDTPSAKEGIPVAPPHYLEAPFRLDDADHLGLPAYGRFLSKPPLFYPRAADIFSWIDSAKPNWHSLQDLIKQPDLAEETFPKRHSDERFSDSLRVAGLSGSEQDKTEKDGPQDAVDQYIARLSEEASKSVNEDTLRDRMRVNPRPKRICARASLSWKVFEPRTN